ncbi:MAG: ATP-binding protein [Chloroflexi bacterium]|nr:ATP-binding protein [Chloroflexota bacterium]
MTASILPADSELFRVLDGVVRERRCVFFAGLPGVGKSLLLQQQAILAQEAGRVVHRLQWDVARSPFETAELLARYPETDGVTHAVIRKAAGLWARDALASWDAAYPEPHHLLIGEAPLIGNRLIELVQPRDDGVEGLLAGDASLFLIPVPSREVRQQIESARVRDMADPAHERERANAVPTLVQSLWEDVANVGTALGLPEAAGLASTEAAGLGPADSAPSRPFDPDLYGAVYLRLLRHRVAVLLPITAVLPVQASVYAGLDAVHELMPTPDEVAREVSRVAARPAADVEREVEDWFRV